MKISKNQLKELIKEETRRLNKKALLESKLKIINSELDIVNEGRKKKKTKDRIDQEDLHRIAITKNREDQKEQGMFDGRFKTKSEKDKTKYDRKDKHKGDKDWA